MTTWYVSSNGSDSNDGLSWASAKLTLANVFFSGSFGDNPRLNGDTILFSGSFSQSLYLYSAEKLNKFGVMQVPGNTSYGYFDRDSQFCSDAKKSADFITRTLGYPIMDVQLTDPDLYLSYEYATAQYSQLVNNAEAINYLSTWMGQSFTTSSNWTGKLPIVTMNLMKRFIAPASDWIGRGGNYDLRTGSVQITVDQDWIDLTDWMAANASGKHVQIRDVYWAPVPAIMRYMNPMGAFGFGNNGGYAMSDLNNGGVMFSMVRPMFDLSLRAQNIQLNDDIRRSQYSYIIVNNKIRLTPPVPENAFLYFTYTMPEDPLMPDWNDPATAGITYDSSSNVTGGIVTSLYNVPFGVVTYQNISSMGKQWIKNYALAHAKEILSHIRGTYDRVPIPGQDVTLNHEQLRSEASEEKTKLMEQIKEDLSMASLKTLMETESAMMEQTQANLQKMPLPPGSVFYA